MDSFFAACSDLLFGPGRLAMNQIIIGSATNVALEALCPPRCLPKEMWEADSVLKVKQLFSFHAACGRACGAIVLSPGPPEHGKKAYAVASAGELDESLVAEAFSMADPELVNGLNSVVGLAAACEVVAAVLQKRRPGLGRRPGLLVVAMEQAADVAKEALALPGGLMRRVLPLEQDCAPQDGGICEEAISADEALLETLTDWHVGFVRDALREEQPREGSRRIMEGLVAKGTLYVWEVEGQGPVALASAGRWLADVGCSLNLVYTPPEHRRRRYAQALITAVGAALRRGGRRVCLFADGDGQHGAIQMYEKLGYQRLGWHHQLRFSEEQVSAESA